MRDLVRRFFTFAALAAASVGGLEVQAAETLDGFWMDSDGEVILEWAPCGDSRCGRVAWLRKPFGPDGKLLLDYRNPEPSLRSRPVCGLEVVRGFKKQADGRWGGGDVYVSDQGMTFSGFAEVLSPTKVKVTGYIGLEIFGASEVWTRVAGKVEPCWAKGAKAGTQPQARGEALPWSNPAGGAPAQ